MKTQIGLLALILCLIFGIPFAANRYAHYAHKMPDPLSLHIEMPPVKTGPEPGHFFVLEGGTRNVLIRCEQYDLSQQTYSGCVLNKEDPAALDKAVTIIIQQMQRLRIEANPTPTRSQRPRQLRSQQSAQTKDQ